MVHDMAFIITPQYGVWPCHSDGVAPSPTICYRTTMPGLRMTWHLSLRHNMGCDHTIPMGLRHYTPLLSHHNVGYNHTILMGLPHYQPFVTAPQREDGV